MLIFVVPLIILGHIGDPWFIVFIVGLIVLMGSVFGLTVHGYYTMKYTLTHESLILKWSFFKRIIPLDTISSISPITSTKIQGIRSLGVGIPGHLVGRFHLKFNGQFISTSLLATKMESLVILRTSTGKTFGVTPDKREEFVNLIQSTNSSIEKTELDTKEPIRTTEQAAKKSRNWISVFFVICVMFAIGTLIYTLIAYQELPEIIPLHWGVGGIPNRFGDKSELLVVVSIFLGIELLVSVLVYLWMRKSDLGKVKLGKLIMLFPLVINLTFSTLMIVIMQATLNYF